MSTEPIHWINTFICVSYFCVFCILNTSGRLIRIVLLESSQKRRSRVKWVKLQENTKVLTFLTTISTHE
jgi:hypothetical protein